MKTHSEFVDYEMIGKRIRKRRKEKGLSQDQLGEQVGISLSFMGHIERGTRKASVETLARLSKALGMDMHYIVFGCSNGYNAESGLLNDLRELLSRY